MDHGMFILLNKTEIKCSKLTHLKEPNNLLSPNTQNIRTDQPAATSQQTTKIRNFIYSTAYSDRLHTQGS